MLNAQIVIIHNIISPYKTLLFNAIFGLHRNIKVLYISETEKRREWEVKKDDLKFPCEIMFDCPADEVSKVPLFKETWDRLNGLNPAVLIIDGYSYASSWAGLLWAKRNKKKIILWSSSNEDDHVRAFYKEFVKGIFVRNCDAYNVYGTKSRDYLFKLGAKKDRIYIVGNNTDNEYFRNETLKWSKQRSILCQEFGIPDNNFLYIGRFSAEKNILGLLDAFRRMSEKNNNWGMILVGSGPQQREIESYIRNHSIKNVLLPGFKQREEVPKFLAVSDVFVLPSNSEPWGLVVNEAMAAGLPVLVSKKCGCYPDLVKDGENGFSFDPFDKEELFALMQKIADGEVDLRMFGEKSVEIIKEYTPDRAARIVVETIERIK